MKLHFEPLERRDLLTAMRIASWNTANNPDDPVGDADYAMILGAIGDESVQGNSLPIDLLALQETDVPGSGGDSIGRIETILEGLYPSVDFDFSVSTLDGGGDSTGFVYNTNTLSLLDAQQLDAGLTHTTIRGLFRPVGTTGDADFYMYSTHLKAGPTAGDQSIRAAEASLLRADIDSLGIGAQVILAGDFNIQSSSESSYVSFLADGPGQLHDPISTPGDWHNDNAFRSVHTQNPADPALGGGGMDDRFDFQLITGELMDGVGIDYVSGSYRAFGNNGTHSLNGSITSGTGAAVAVLDALAVASDHLPVVADYEILGTTAGITISESGSGTVVAEGGAIDTYTVSLTSTPVSDVTVTVMPDVQTDLGAGPGTSISLVFTPSNAFTGQSVIVSANDDLIAEGTHSSLITHASVSNDPDYDNLLLDDVNVTVLDDEAPTIVINEVDADTEGVDRLEFVELFDGGIGNSSLAGLTVVFYNGANDESYSSYDLDGFSTDSDGFFLLGNSQLVPSPNIVFNDNRLQNGADAVALYAADASDFPNGTAITTADLLDAVVYDTDDGDDVELLGLLLAGQPQINEDENNNQIFDSNARVPDGGLPRVTTSFQAQTPTPGTFNAQPATGIVVVQSGGRTDVEEGGLVDSYTIALASFPDDDVTITVAPDGQLNLGAGPGIAIQRIFTPTNAIVPQTIVVMAVDDSAIEGPHTSLIAHTSSSSDPAYDGIAIGNVVANIADNESAPETNVVISEIMYNPDSDETSPGVAEWIEVVNKGNVPIQLDGWSFDDEDSTDWGAFPVGTLLDINQVAVFFDSQFTTEAEFRSSWSVPAASLVVGIPWGSLSNSPTPSDEILQLLDNSGQSQDSVNWDDSGDWPGDNPDGASIRLLDTASDNNLGVSWAKSVLGSDNAVTPTLPFSAEDVGSPGFVDCPIAEIVVTESGGSTMVTEGGPGDSLQIVLAGLPTADVEVTLTPTNPQIDFGMGPGSPVTLTFTPANAATSQLVAVTAVDDAIAEGAHSSSIVYSTSSTDPVFDGLIVGTTTVSIDDNDSALADGDFDNDGDYDCTDIDTLVAEIAFASSDLSFDLTGDGFIDAADLDAWLLEAGEFNLGPGRAYLPGDADLSGAVNGADFIIWNTNKFQTTNAWCRGDFNADGVTNGVDFVVWNSNKFQSSDRVLRELNQFTGAAGVEHEDRQNESARLTQGTIEAPLQSNSPLRSAVPTKDVEQPFSNRFTQRRTTSPANKTGWSFLPFGQSPRLLVSSSPKTGESIGSSRNG